MWPRSPSAASRFRPGRRSWSATRRRRWPLTPRRSATASPMNCAAACSAPSGCRACTSSSAYEVRRLITGVMWPQEDITDRLASPDIPSLLLRDPDLTRIVRRSGGTIAWDGQPLTTVGWRRIRQWRQEWLALPSQVVPAVTGLDQVVRPGREGLRYLADLASTAGPRAVCPYLPVPSRVGPPGLRRLPGRPDKAASTDMTGGGPARTCALPPGHCWQGRAREPGHVRVSCAIPLLAARRPRDCTTGLISIMETGIK